MIEESIKRIKKGIGANIYNQAVNFVCQVLSIPFFLSVWNAKEYGVWIMLTAIPSYFAIADLGITSIASNKINMAAAAKNWKEANDIFQSAQVILILASLIGLSTCFIIIQLVKPENEIVIMILTANVFLILFGNLIQTVYKADLKYEAGVFWDTNTRLAEWISTLAAASITHNYLYVAFFMFITRLSIITITCLRLQRHQSNLKWGIKYASLHEVRTLLRPSLAFSLFPIGNALNIQGYIIIVGHLLGPTILVVFNSYRTISRVVVQTAGIISHSVWPEISRHYSLKNKDMMNSIYREFYITSVKFIMLLTLFAFVFYFLLLEYWSNNNVEFDLLLSLAFCVYAVMASIWHLPRIFLIATNNHHEIALCYLFVNVTMLFFTYFLSGNIYEAVFFMGLSELICFICSIKLKRKKIKI